MNTKKQQNEQKTPVECYIAHTHTPFMHSDPFEPAVDHRSQSPFVFVWNKICCVHETFGN